jgi:hypothetical protein
MQDIDKDNDGIIQLDAFESFCREEDI